MNSFNALSEAALGHGALDKKTKELIALVLGVAAHCDAWPGCHAKALVKAAQHAPSEGGLGVAIYVGGGPSLMCVRTHWPHSKNSHRAEGLSR